MSPPPGFNQLCASATLLARTLLTVAQPSSPPNATALAAVSADCALVVDLVHCLTVNPGCELLNAVAPGAFGASVAAAATAVVNSGGTATTNLYAQNPPSLYPSSYIPMFPSYVT